VAAERAVRVLMHQCRPELARDAAPRALRERCAALTRSSNRAAGAALPAAPGLLTRQRLVPLALAAGFLMAVGGVFVYQTGASSRLLAAELAADHVKCFGMLNPMLHTHDAAGAVEASMASRFDWHMRLPIQPERAGLELVGARPCLYGKGFVAHIMYRSAGADGDPVSVFMLPEMVRTEEVLEVLGHQASIWSDGGRTFVLVARRPRHEIARLTSFVQTALR
jgi:hypothetical protein